MCVFTPVDVSDACEEVGLLYSPPRKASPDVCHTASVHTRDNTLHASDATVLPGLMPSVIQCHFASDYVLSLGMSQN